MTQTLKTTDYQTRHLVEDYRPYKHTLITGNGKAVHIVYNGQGLIVHLCDGVICDPHFDPNIPF